MRNAHMRIRGSSVIAAMQLCFWELHSEVTTQHHGCIAAERALDTLNYTPLGGKPLRIMWSHRDPAFRKSGVGNIYIKVGQPVPLR